MTYAALLSQVHAAQLDIFGAFHPEPQDRAPEKTGTLLLLGPDEPGFWANITQSPEWADGTPNAIDRWSTRVVTALAAEMGGQPIFPFSGPPWHPFIAWAKRSGRAWESPATLLVHDRAGLMVSYRGAIALKDAINLPETKARPCDTCVDKPCLSACPVNALTPNGYDIPGCKGYLSTREGKESCMSMGCAVRRSCPLSFEYGRLPAQSAYHMSHFA